MAVLQILLPVGRVHQHQVLRQAGVAQTRPAAEVRPAPVGLPQVNPPHVVLLPRLQASLGPVGVGEPGSAPTAPQHTVCVVQGRL